MKFFYFNIPFQVAIGKHEFWWSLAIIAHPTPPDLQLQLELLSSLQNLIIYHKMDIIKSAWINP